VVKGAAPGAKDGLVLIRKSSEGSKEIEGSSL
jgi:ribosomal protein L3